MLFGNSPKIAGLSEKYWCGIKHKEDEDFIPPAHHAGFVDYGDKEAFEKKHPPSKIKKNRDVA